MSARSFFNYAIILLLGIALGVAACTRIASGNRERTSQTSAHLAAESALASEDSWKSDLSEEEIRVRRTPVVEAVEKVGPAVVNISTEKIVQRRVSPFSNFRDDFFDDFFDPFFDRYNTRDFKQQTLGTGVIIDSRGYIVTNEHVILRASEITVTLPDDTEYTARVIGADPKFDLAILKIDPENELPVAKTGDSNAVMIGETVIAIGNPFGLGHTVTTGVLSAKGRSINTKDGRTFSDFLQTDASINPGNSGGPLVNLMGEIIGINTAIYADAEGIGFAIPINRAMRAVTELVRFGEIKKTWTGMRVQPLTERLAARLGLKTAAGVLVSDIMKDTPAETAGLQPGDAVTAVNNLGVANVDEFNSRMGALMVGERVSLKILRDGAEKTIVMEMEALPLDRAEEIGRQRFGFVVESITRNDVSRYRLRTTSGVLVTKVDTGTPASEIGIEPGDVLRQIGTVEIKDKNGYLETVIQAASHDEVFAVIQRGAYLYHLKF